MITVTDLQFLRSAAGQTELAELATVEITPHNHLQIVSRLRQQLTAEQAQAVLETAVLRQHGRSKFSRAGQMFFTRPALEQASAEAVSLYRAQRFVAAGYGHIADLGCSIGGDALALAAQAEVTGVEWDPVRLAMAQENVAVYGHGRRFRPLQADLLALTPFAAEALFFDPARRDEHGRRFYSVAQYQPPLSLIERWQGAGVRGTAVKVSPGIDYAEIPAAAEAEFISLAGEVKECLLWGGGLHSGVGRRATLLPGGHSLTDADLPAAPIAVSQPLAYLYEPDGAVIRAHLVEALAAQLGGCKIDEQIAYVTAVEAKPTPFAHCYQVVDFFPFQLKRLRHYLHKNEIGDVIIKKRGSPLDPDKLQQQLRLKGPKENKCILFLTHIQGEAAVVIGQKLF